MGELVKARTENTFQSITKYGVTRLAALLAVGLLGFAASPACFAQERPATVNQPSEPHPAFGDFINYCNQHYSDIDAVYWNTRSEVPPELVGADWSEVEKRIGKTLERLIARNSGIAVVKTADTAEHVLSEHPKSLYLAVVFSYARKDAFSTPLRDNVLAIWTETTRNQPNKDYTGTIPYKSTSAIDFHLFNTETLTFQGRPLVSGNDAFFVGANTALTREGCQVLVYSTDKVCTHPTPHFETTVVPQKEAPCIKGPPMSPEENPVQLMKRLKP